MLRTILLVSAAALLPAAGSPVVAGFERFGDGAAGVSPGLLLYNELDCAACHGPLRARQSAFPPRTAPNLANVSERVQFEYLMTFIAAPHDVKPGTTMPDLFAGWDKAKAQETIEALAHFLASLGGSLPADIESPSGELLERGAHLFHTVGCVACHEPARPPEANAAPADVFGAADAVVDLPEITVPSVPLPDLARKTSAAALAAFLLDPGHARPGGRMPNMTLTESEANAIANWLVFGTQRTVEEGGTAVPAVQDGQPPDVDPAKAEQGRVLFQQLGCAACHAVADTKPLSALRPLAGQELAAKGCLAETPANGVPWFGLSQDQREALLALNAAHVSDDATAFDIVSTVLLALNCYACHERGGIGGPEPGRGAYFTETEALDLGDEGRMPPALTGVGSKLTPDWLHAILTSGGRVRPYMATRMPHFDENQVAHLAEAFLTVDKDPEPLPINVSGLEHHHRNMYGRELMGVNGLGCVTCHVLNGHPSLGIPAVDLANVPERIQPEWFMRYMLNPASLRPQTRMPAFFEKGKSLGSKLFNGGAVMQIEALWIYLREVQETRLPEGMEDTTDYELKPTDHPIVHRTFMKGVGAHAIAVGFPEGIHFAYDALDAHPALVWRGRFIDAESAWADRFTPFDSPLGKDTAKLPKGVSIALNRDGPWPSGHDGPRFLGYHLDASRTPVFRYRLGDVTVEESLRPSEDKSAFVRQLTFTGAAGTVYLRMGVGTLEADSGKRIAIGKLVIQTTQGPPSEAGPEDVGWVLPVAVTESGTTIEQVISW